MLPCDLRRTIDAINSAAADNAMSDISVVFTSGEANTNCSVDAFGILKGNISRPRRDVLTINPERLPFAGTTPMLSPSSAVVLVLFNVVRHSLSIPA